MKTGHLHELGPLGLCITPEASYLCWRRVAMMTLRRRRPLAERLIIAASKRLRDA